MSDPNAPREVRVNASKPDRPGERCVFMTIDSSNDMQAMNTRLNVDEVRLIRKRLKAALVMIGVDGPEDT